MKTLRIRFPAGGTLLQALVGLLLFGLVLEAFARTSYAGKVLPMQAYGDSHPTFGVQLNMLKDRVKRDGAVDCIFIGSSQVAYDINPGIVEETVDRLTGRTIRCQNFGIAGQVTRSLPALATLLIREFQPSVLIFGTGMYDYSSTTEVDPYESLISSPWIRYGPDELTVDGWLIDNSDAYRYYLGLQRVFFEGAEIIRHPTGNGYGPPAYERVGTTPEVQALYFQEGLKRAGIGARRAESLRRFFELQSPRTRTAVLELPMDPLMLSVIPDAVRVNERFEAMLKRETAAAGVLHWRSDDPIPNGGWYDLIHLNGAGARYFGGIVGGFMADAILAGSIELSEGTD